MPDGWTVSSIDVWGAVLAQRTDNGIELAHVTPSAAPPASTATPTSEPAPATSAASTAAGSEPDSSPAATQPVASSAPEPSTPSSSAPASAPSDVSAPASTGEPTVATSGTTIPGDADCPAYTEATSYPVQQCDSGTAVLAIQNALTFAGENVAYDGAFGPATDAAVRRFQAANSLVVDGIVGPQTWDAMLAGARRERCRRRRRRRRQRRGRPVGGHRRRLSRPAPWRLRVTRRGSTWESIGCSGR